MKEYFNLNAATWSGTAFTTSSTGIVTAQQNYTELATTAFYLDEDISKYQIVEISNGLPTSSKNITRGVKHTTTASSLTGYFYKTTGTDSYINVEVNADYRTNFTFLCLSSTTAVGKQILMEARYGNQLRYQIYTEAGVLYMYFLDLFGESVTVTGPSVTADTLHAIGVSMSSSSICFGVDGVTTEVTTGIDTYNLQGKVNSVYVGGTPLSSTGLIGLIGKPQLLGFALTGASAFANWTVQPLYDETNSSFIVPLTTNSVIIADNPIATGLMVDETFSSDLGFQVSLDDGVTWKIPVSYAWTAVTGVEQASLAEINTHIKELTLSGTMKLKVFPNGTGLQKKTVTSIALLYINDTNPISLVTKNTVNFGETVNLLEHVYSSQSGTINTYVNNTTSFSLGSNDIVIDGDWADRNSLIGEGVITASATVYVNDGIDTVTNSVDIKTYTIEVEDIKFSGGTGQPKVSVYHTNVYPETLVIDSYSTTSGSTKVSLMSGSYKFVIQASDGELYTQYKTITGDTKLTLQGTGIEDIPRTMSVNSLSMTVGDTTLATGDNPTLSFLITDKSTGLAKNLTDYSVYFAMKPAYSSSTTVDKLCTVTGIGKATVQLTSSETTTAGRYIAEVSIEKTGETLTVIPHFYVDIIEGLR